MSKRERQFEIVLKFSTTGGSVSVSGAITNQDAEDFMGRRRKSQDNESWPDFCLTRPLNAPVVEFGDTKDY